MKESKYLDRFVSMQKEAGDAYELIGDCLLVEHIEPEEVKTTSGIILGVGGDSKRQIGSIASERPQWVYVLAVGKGWYNEETGEDVPLTVEPGDILLVGQASVKWFPTFEVPGYNPFDIGLTRDGETQFRFKKIEGYRRAFSALNSAAEKKME